VRIFETPVIRAILGEWHLRRVPKEFLTYYNTRRPHQGLAQHCPVAFGVVCADGTVQRRDVLGGIIHNSARVAA